jgi:uncharacterized LabA/DUF88 family protein
MPNFLFYLDIFYKRIYPISKSTLGLSAFVAAGPSPPGARAGVFLYRWKMKIAFLIDGFNFYHSIKTIDDRLLWFDYVAYCRHFMRSFDTLHSITYFTSLAFWRTEAVERHKIFLQACTVNGITIIFGKFKAKNIPCPFCHKGIIRHEEKATDVNLALHAYRFAAQGVEKIILVTGDTDLIPAVRMIKSDFPDTHVGIVFPYRRDNRELEKEADFYHKTRKEILHSFRLPERIQKANGKFITCPVQWA